jgi:hypothetical protein
VLGEGEPVVVVGWGEGDRDGAAVRESQREDWIQVGQDSFSPAWTRPRAIFRPTTMTTPLLDARRCTVVGVCRDRTAI